MMLSREHKARAEAIRNRWRDAALSTEDRDRDRVSLAVQALYPEWALAPVSQILFFDDPYEAFGAYNSWKDGIGAIRSCIWQDQVDSRDASRDIVERDDLSQVEDLMAAVLPWDWCDEVAADLDQVCSEVLQELRCRFEDEDPTDQCGIEEFIYLGPFRWLVHEVACAAFCEDVLGAPSRGSLRSVLEDIAAYGGLVLTFRDLCILCDRPTSLRPHPPYIRFANGRHLEPSPPQWIEPHHSTFVTAIAVSEHGWAVSGSADSRLLVWDLGSRRPTRLLEDHSESIHGLTALDEDRFVSASSDETLRIWNVTTGEAEHVLRDHGAPVRAPAVVNRRWLAAGVGSTLWVRDLETLEVTRVTEGQTGRVSAITDLVRDRIVGASSDGTMWVWDLSSGEQIQKWTGHSGNVQAVIKLADQSVVSASDDGTLGVWDPTSGRLLRRLEGHTEQVRGVVGIAGHRAASVSWDRSARIWNMASGETEAVFPISMGGNALALAVTGGEHQLMVGDLAGRVLFLSTQ